MEVSGLLLVFSLFFLFTWFFSLFAKAAGLEGEQSFIVFFFVSLFTLFLFSLFLCDLGGRGLYFFFLVCLFLFSLFAKAAGLEGEGAASTTNHLRATIPIVWKM